MKKIISRIALVLAGICLTLNAIAQSSENPRRIWVVAHACNCHKWLQTALEDGASGVEIDVNCAYNINPTASSVDFSVYHGHAGGYCSPEYRARQNRGIKDPLKYYVSLEEYLKFDEMNKINILWLDAKCEEPGQVYHLVREVHRVLLIRYGSKEEVPFSIIYGFYKMRTLRGNIGNYSLAYPSTPLIDWLRDNLWENEGINLACEGPCGPCKTSETLEQLKDFFNEHNFPKGKHFASQGSGGPNYLCLTQNMINTLIKLKEWRNQGKYCVRTGAWSLSTDLYGRFMVPNKRDYPSSWETECDLVLMEAQNDFKLPSIFPADYDHYALQKFVRRFMRPGGQYSYYSEYNRGHYVLAGNRWEDPFYE